VTQFVQFVVIGLSTGALYALASQGLVLIYRGSGVLNFAQGAVAMAGAFTCYKLQLDSGWARVPAIVLGLAMAGAISMGIELLIMRRLRQASPLMKLVATLGALLIIQSAFALHFGTEPISVLTFLPTNRIEVSGVSVTEDRLILLGLAIVLTAVLWYVYRKTRFGLATTAVTENEPAAAAMGWSPTRIALINWGLGGVFAGLAGILLAPTTGLQIEALTQVVIAAFAGALLANFRSFPLALLGALGVGVMQSLLTLYVDVPGIGSSAPFAVIIVWLMVRGRSLPIRGEFLARLPSIGTGRVRPLVVAPLVAAAAILLLWVLPTTWVGATTTSLAAAIILLSLVVVVGYCGQLALGQYAVAGVGALIGARLLGSAGFPFLVSVALAVLAAALFGMVLFVPAVRVRGAALAIATLGIGIAIFEILFHDESLVGGIGGTPIHPPQLFGLDLNGAVFPERYAVMTLAGFVLAALVVAAVRRGGAGLRMIAVRENERAAASIGVNVVGTKAFAFGLASGLAALGGILLAFQGSVVSYEGFNVYASINAIAYVVIGGLGYLAGPLLGSLLVVGGLGTAIFNEFDIAKYLDLISGIILVLIVIGNPDGQVRAFMTMWEKLRVKLGRPRRLAEAPSTSEWSAALVKVDPARLSIEGLTVRFGGVTAVDGLDLTVQSGKVSGLIGPNGAGKTTVVDAVTGMVPLAAGRIALDGASIVGRPTYKRARAGIVRSFQSLELFEEMTVRENILTACGGEGGDLRTNVASLVGRGGLKPTPAAAAAIEEFQLAGDLDRLPGELPYGKRRLVGIARAVAGSPSILILDEPAAGLSSSEARELGDLVRRLADGWNIGILLIEHNVELIMRVSDEITAVNFGKTIARGTPQQVRNDGAVREAYLGITDGVAA
jgi:sulfate-transporting ATPase